jgi:hypothetical protein
MIGIEFKCSRTGGPFNVSLRKTDKYRIAQIQAVGSGNAAVGHSGSWPVELDAATVDFAGFYCPICSFNSSGALHPFVRCGTCGDLACGATIRKVAMGYEFSCYCGGFGLLSGQIDSYKATEEKPAEKGHLDSKSRASKFIIKNRK